MNQHILKYTKIVNTLVRKSFPSLKGNKILILEYPTWIYWANAFTFIHPSCYFIFINKKIRKFDRKSASGLLAHELCHFETEGKTKNIFQAVFHYLKINLSWVFNTSLSRSIERKTDLLTIKKGYGGQLLSFNSKTSKGLSKIRLQKRYSRGYLSLEEIKIYMKKKSK